MTKEAVKKTGSGLAQASADRIALHPYMAKALSQPLVSDSAGTSKSQASLTASDILGLFWRAGS